MTTPNTQPIPGHFKMQPYGPANSLRKLIFVSATTRRNHVNIR